MIAEWRQLGRLTKIFYVCELVGLMGSAIMIPTGLTGIGAIWEVLKRRPFCM